MGHFADDKVFRTSNGSESFEVFAPTQPDRTFGLGMDSFDAHEIGMRLDRDAAKALAEWLISRLSEIDHAEAEA